MLEKERKNEYEASDFKRKGILKEIAKKKFEIEENGHLAY